MKKKLLLLLLITIAAQAKINWVDWSPDLFQKADKEKKLVILDLEAVWCHWCHVMEAKTYSNTKVEELISLKFIAVRVDQDARPDISRKYEDYGWPATIFFDSMGRELAKRSGFIPTDEMIPLLEKLIKKPIPEEKEKKKEIKTAKSPYLTVEQKLKLRKSYNSQYDSKLGGWGDVHKFLFGETEEYALRSTWRGDKKDAEKVKKTLNANLSLIDPVWGGVYQYSVNTWNEPHFEKIAEAQMKNLILYSLGASYFSDSKYLQAAKEVQKYLSDFLLSPEGSFYTSQDADLVQGVHSDGYFKLDNVKRRSKGIPIIDKHRYSRENGWFVRGLLAYYSVSRNEKILDLAEKAVKWVERARFISGGGFRHDEVDKAGPYLGDTLEMAQAFLKLYEVTAQKEWLLKARNAADFILENFSNRSFGRASGFFTAKTAVIPGTNSEIIRDENTSIARFGNLLFHYTGNRKYREMAEQAMRYVAVPEVAEARPTAAVLLADEEMNENPVHLTIIGKKADPIARDLFLTAISYPISYKRVEWWDKSEGDLMNNDVKYPVMEKAAAFACTSGRCSLPVFKATELRERVDKLYH